MPSPAAEAHHATRVQTLLHQRGAAHLRARKRGATVIVESGPAADPVRHFRLRRDTVHLWYLDMATHTGRWQTTPFRAYLDELVAMVVDSFPWTLAPVE
jgi:hypothetical protein